MEADSSNSTDDVVAVSRQKLLAVAESLQPWLPNVTCRPLVPSLDECVGYRSRCSFQMVRTDTKLQYAIRRQQEPVIIETYPVANQRIQNAMLLLRQQLDTDRFPDLRQHLTSVSFATSWKDVTNSSATMDDSDCLVTLHYDESFADPDGWIAQARDLCTEIQCTQVSGRARKRCLRATPRGFDDTDPAVIRDTLWLYKKNAQTVNWTVSMTRPLDEDNVKVVRYEKPEDAFAHPNATAMCRALEWMLSRVESIQVERHKNANVAGAPLRLLELYCGCGAHTMALRQANLLTDIVAVELDERLVEACQRNMVLNTSAEPTGDQRTTVDVVSMDAGLWATRTGTVGFDILLVDPPKQGLVEQVCRMAIMGTFQHVLYISCGHEALVRDLDRLLDFEVVDCVLLDLFPQTQAVESLVHLRRRSTA